MKYKKIFFSKKKDKLRIQRTVLSIPNIKLKARYPKIRWYLKFGSFKRFK